MSVELLQQQYNEIIRQKEHSLHQLELKYTDYIQTLLQQKLLIRTQISRKYDELISNINNSIHNTISTNINDFIGSQIVNERHISNTPESLMNDININEHNIDIHSENEPLKTITYFNHNQSPNFVSNLLSCPYTNINVKHSSKRRSQKFRLTFKNKNKNPSKNKQNHMNQIQANNGKYPCAYCPKEKPYKCNHCNNSFTEKNNLKTHINQIHTNNGKYACKYCEKRFSAPSQLVTHTKTYTKEKPWKCNFCNKSFTQKGTLTIHKRIHTGEKPFKCNECNKSFTQKGTLTTHKRIHTGKKPFSCNKCGKKYSDGSNRNAHQNKCCKTKQIV